MSIGDNIRRAREKAGMTSNELGKRVGVSYSMILQIERGTKACSIALGLALAKALGVTLYDLIGEDAEGPAI